MGRYGHEDALIVWAYILGRQHVVNARPGRWLENTFGECIGDEGLDFFGTFSLGAPLGHLEDPREERTRTFGIHALRFLARRDGVLNDGREAVLAVAYLDVP